MGENNIYKFKTLDGKEIEKEFIGDAQAVFLFKNENSYEMAEQFVDNENLISNIEKISDAKLEPKNYKNFFGYMLKVTSDLTKIKKYAEVSLKDGAKEIDFNALENVKEIERFSNDFFSFVNRNLQ